MVENKTIINHSIILAYNEKHFFLILINLIIAEVLINFKRSKLKNF